MHLAAEPAENLFVEERRQAAGQRLVDDEADGIRSDVDDGNRRSRLARRVREPRVPELLKLMGWTADVPSGA